MSLIVSSALMFWIRVTKATSRKVRTLHYKILGLNLGDSVLLGQVEIPQNFSEISLSDGVSLEDGVVLLAVGANAGKKKITIGENTYVGHNCFIDAADQIRIGRNVAIGANCYITDHDHGTQTGEPILAQPLVSSPTIICDGVKLGASVIVHRGVTIGANTVVVAGSAVTRDLPPGVLAAGRPASAMKKR